MTDQLRDGHARFASGGMNELFRAKSGVRVGVAHPESHDVLNDRLRAGRSPSSDDARSEDEAPQIEGLDGGVRTRVEPEVSTSDVMNRALRVAAGREAPDGRHTNGLPMRD